MALVETPPFTTLSISWSSRRALRLKLGPKHGDLGWRQDEGAGQVFVFGATL